jgi:hypothetical protein
MKAQKTYTELRRKPEPTRDTTARKLLAWMKMKSKRSRREEEKELSPENTHPVGHHNMGSSLPK